MTLHYRISYRSYISTFIYICDLKLVHHILFLGTISSTTDTISCMLVNLQYLYHRCSRRFYSDFYSHLLQIQFVFFFFCFYFKLLVLMTIKKSYSADQKDLSSSIIRMYSGFYNSLTFTLYLTDNSDYYCL